MEEFEDYDVPPNVTEEQVRAFLDSDGDCGDIDNNCEDVDCDECLFNGDVDVEVVERYLAHKTRKIAIHCPTQELWNEAQDKAIREGMRWASAGRFDGWDAYREGSCIILDIEQLTYSNKASLSESYKIISAEEYLDERPKEMKMDNFEGRRVPIIATEQIQRILSMGSSCHVTPIGCRGEDINCGDCLFRSTDGGLNTELIRRYFDRRIEMSGPMVEPTPERREGVKNYLVALNTEEQEKLSDNQIPSVDFEGGTLIAEEDIGKTLEVLDAIITSESQTPYEGIMVITFSKAMPEELKGLKAKEDLGTTGQELRSSNRNSFLKSIREILIPVLKKNVSISVPHGRTRQIPKKKDDFHIYIYSTVSGARRDASNGYSPEILLEVPVPCRSASGDRFSGKGIAIIDETTGWEIAELFESALFIHHDMNHTSDKHVKELFQKICIEAAMEISMAPEEKEAHKKALAIEKSKAARHEYIKICSGRTVKQKHNAEQNIKESERIISEFQTAITTRVRQMREEERRLTSFKELDGDVKRYEEEYDKLLSMPKVSMVHATEEMIQVYTDILFCEHGGDIYEIGAFRIDIYAGRGDVRWHNLTRTINTGGEGGDRHLMNAPHIDSHGKACYGNTSEIWPQLIADYEFAAVAMIAIQFIESVNAQDAWGKYIVRWPKVERKTDGETKEQKAKAKKA